MNISFIICCYNSARRLRPTLAHLGAVDPVPDLDWEVVIVDNASTDDTAAAAQGYWSEAGAPAPLRVVRESTPGLVHARRCGVRAARHEIVCFVDDDNWIGPEWLRILNEIFTSRPAVGAVGGVGRPVFEGPEPGWFGSVQSAYAVGPQAPQSGEVPKARGYLYGAGLALRRRAFLDCEKKRFPALLTGRKGGELGAGDDSELCFQLAISGWRLWYDERLTFVHFMPASRLTPVYAARLFEQMGYASAYLDAYAIAGAVERPVHWVLLNRTLPFRFLIAAAQCLRSYLGPRLLGADADMRTHLFRGRLKGILTDRRRYRALRHALPKTAARQKSE